jgi:hypothetical protein
VVGFTLLEVISILVILYVLIEVTGINLLAAFALALVVRLALLEFLVIFFIVLLNVTGTVLLAALALALVVGLTLVKLIDVLLIVVLSVAGINLLTTLALAYKTLVSVLKARCENTVHTLVVRLTSHDIGSVQVRPVSIIILLICCNVTSTILLAALALALVMASLDLHHGITSILLAAFALALVVRLTSLNHSSTASESSNEVGSASWEACLDNVSTIQSKDTVM